jgi:hypothetical protein
MDDDVDPSFHGSLARFAYVDPRTTSDSSSPPSHHRPGQPHADSNSPAALPQNGIPFSNVMDADGAGDGSANIIALLSSPPASEREAGEEKSTEKRRERAARGGPKRRNGRGSLGGVDPGFDLCAGLNGIPDHVAKDLDGALRPTFSPFYVPGDLRGPIYLFFLTPPFLSSGVCSVVLWDQVRRLISSS